MAKKKKDSIGLIITSQGVRIFLVGTCMDSGAWITGSAARSKLYIYTVM